MGKRKRNEGQNGDLSTASNNVNKKPKPQGGGPIPSTNLPAPTTTSATDSTYTIQIVTGSYDRILNGVIVTLEQEKGADEASKDTAAPTATFADSFLFNAHTSAIRCVALSPPSKPIPGQAQKVLLASGSTDERINVYSLSAHPPSQRSRERQKQVLAASGVLSLISPGGGGGKGGKTTAENSANRELGTLLHHNSSVTRLAFPTRGKLASASEDSTVAFTRTRDWALLSSVKSPVPVPKGRPSGDTAAVGMAPSGVNDFAVHPSLKTMISVGKGERCMRLWNLVTGRKAGVLNFAKEVLRQCGEGRHSTGEGRRVVWGSAEEVGDEFAVAFDRDVVVFGMDAVARCRVLGPDIKTKVHALRYLELDPETERSLLAVSTEDGRILFFSTRPCDLAKQSPPTEGQGPPATLATARLVASLGGRDAGVTSRIKDFSILKRGEDSFYVVAGSSDGKLWLWRVGRHALNTAIEAEAAKAPSKGEPGSIGEQLGVYETRNRITCLEAFAMISRPDGLEDTDDEDEDEEFEAENGTGESSDSDEEK